jgi:hypothetical protein
MLRRPEKQVPELVSGCATQEEFGIRAARVRQPLNRGEINGDKRSLAAIEIHE